MIKEAAFLSLICFLCGANFSFSQPIIEFESITHDFGQIEEGTIAEYEFKFTNEGDQPLVLSSVKASCGCTTPSWTKQPILPGKQGHIKASYNSNNRPGGFHKSITITSNASSATKVLYVKGVAIKSQLLEPIFTAEELENAPRAEILQQHLQLGKIQIGSSLPIKLTIQNKGKSSLEINGVLSSCRCVSMMPGRNLVVEPNATGILELVYSPRSLGEFTHGAYILSNDIVQPKYQIYITSVTVPEQSKSSVVKEAPSTISF